MHASARSRSRRRPRPRRRSRRHRRWPTAQRTTSPHPAAGRACSRAPGLRAGQSRRCARSRARRAAAIRASSPGGEHLQPGAAQRDKQRCHADIITDPPSRAQLESWKCRRCPCGTSQPIQRTSPNAAPEPRSPGHDPPHGPIPAGATYVAAAVTNAGARAERGRAGYTAETTSGPTRCVAACSLATCTARAMSASDNP